MLNGTQQGVVSLPSSDSTQRGPRILGLDYLRACAAVLVVALHAAIPYMSDPMPLLRWAIEPSEKSDLVNLIGWSVDGFIMPIFFLMSGYFGAQLYSQRGPNKFLKNRLARVGLPFLFACAFVLPLSLYTWMLGWVSSDLIRMKDLLAVKIDGELGDALHGFSHLWYLQYVLLYSALACVILAFAKRSPRQQYRTPNRAIQSLNGSSTVVLVAGILFIGSVLYIEPTIVIGFRHGWLPFWENVLFYAVPFTMGWFWPQVEHSKQKTKAALRKAAMRIVLACGVFFLMWPQLRYHLQTSPTEVENAALPYLFASYNLLMSTGLFGGALMLHLTRIPATVKYLAEASFWIYLFHHPAVAIIQVDLLFSPISPALKFLITTTGGLAICLVTYEFLVRRTWIGRMLNGSTKVRGTTADRQFAPPAEKAA
ncbi:acyltransferase family protein [Planctomicrobium sp. SH668]|uniref:acyltransferase family protein n=1 Tax=Planctomicrobium sp. SH668 TaxID=3448126 RepID=UPI003F5AECC4